MDDASSHPTMYNTTEHHNNQRPLLPSETRDFAPTPGGWVAIIMTAGVLAWLIWRQGGDRFSSSGLVLSVVLGYVVAMMT